MLERFGGGKRAEHPFDIRALRNSILAGGSWPIPPLPPWGNAVDFWDQEPLGEMTVH
jgi:hypothetical protein